MLSASDTGVRVVCSTDDDNTPWVVFALVSTGPLKSVVPQADNTFYCVLARVMRWGVKVFSNS